MSKTKSFLISKEVVFEAYLRVKASKGAGGVDNESMTDFEVNLKDRLYKIWNRMSSGSYFPPPVLLVDIPKSDGGKRTLGIPTVSDRIAQMVVKMYLEPSVEVIFHDDSYGYRPFKSALDAVNVVRQRCWRKAWVIDLDIKGFFDSIDHSLMMRAVRKHTKSTWMLLYIERWLKAPAQCNDGSLRERDRGTPQGGVVSPLLANIFLHHAFDDWMKVNFPGVQFARYADDAVVHCVSENQARLLLQTIEERLKRCKLKIHPAKTKIVYCKQSKWTKEYPIVKFDFLGYTFRPRLSRSKYGEGFVSFTPAISNKAANSIKSKVRSWNLGRASFCALEDMAKVINPKVRGWINYYGRFGKSELYPVLRHLERSMVKWAMRKFKRLKDRQRKATYWLGRIARRNPQLFSHWQLGFKPLAGQ